MAHRCVDMPWHINLSLPHCLVGALGWAKTMGVNPEEKIRRAAQALGGYPREGFPAECCSCPIVPVVLESLPATGTYSRQSR